LGVPVNVVSATGGGGVTGHTRGALARPDGYTLTMATVELNMLHWRGLTDVSFRDFEPLVLLNRDEAAVFVRHDAPWKTIVELETAIRNRPGELKASGTARGGIWHIALAGWLDARGMPTDAVTWISINGAAPSLQELMADGVEMVCCSLPEARSLMDGGQLRCLGIMGDARLPAAPDVPTFREAGIDWTLGGWRGIMFPENVPRDRAAIMQEALLRVARSKQFVRYMDSAGFQLQVAGSEEFEQLLAERDAQFGAILSSPAFAQVSRSPLGPLVFPGLVVGLGIAVLLVLLWRGQLRLEWGTAPLTRQQIARLAWAPACVVFFALAADYAGFILAAGVMLLSLLLALRVRLLTAAVLTMVLVPSVYHVFAVNLGVPLPWGWLGW
jgi:tripartite-type tricarboxylate transporter receptor subunit TctC